MSGLNRIGAGRDVLDDELAIRTGQGVVGAVHDGHPSEHPRMHVALELQKFLRLHETVGEIRTAGHLGGIDAGLVGRFIFLDGGVEVDIVQDGV